MKVIAVDDEKLALASSIGALKQVFREDEIQGFCCPKDVLAYMKECVRNSEEVEYAFLDVEMYDMTGIELAKKLKELCPQIRIFFITGYNQYAYDAFRIHVSGYLLKPITKDAIVEELRYCDVYKKAESEKKIRIQTFGNFEVFVDEQVLFFERTKEKELFAYLVDRNGAGVKTAEISGILYEDRDYDRNVRNQTQTVISCLMKDLRQVGIEDVIIKKWNHLAIDTSKVTCDYYQFLKGDVQAINAYMGEYMNNYSWAEFTTASLEEKQLAGVAHNKWRIYEDYDN